MEGFVAVLGFNSCSNKGGHGEDNHINDLGGTWTCLTADYAEALLISADGSLLSTGVEDGEYWENVAGEFSLDGHQISMVFEDGDDWEGSFEFVPGEALVFLENDGSRIVYKYCEEDFSEEIVGMWVCTGGTNVQGAGEVIIQTYRNDGTSLFTGTALPNTTGVTMPNMDGYLVNSQSDYIVVGDLLIRHGNKYVAMRLNYMPNGTKLGDIMTTTTYLTHGNEVINAVSSYLRVKQHLGLAGNAYDYSKVFVSNVKGEDKDINFMGYNFNFSKMDGYLMDRMMKSMLCQRQRSLSELKNSERYVLWLT